MSNILIIDPNGRRPMTAKHEIELTELEGGVISWLHGHLLNALKTARNGKAAIDLGELKARMDQVYFLGRNHEAG